MSAPASPSRPAATAAGQPARPPVRGKVTAVVFISMAICAVVFSLWPGLDLAVSALFFDPALGFAGERNALVMAVYRGVPVMSKAIIIVLFISLFAYCLQRGPHGRRRRIQVGYLIVALALGPGLLIDVALKDYWGRARPAKVEQFGGPSTFTPALMPSDQCDSNCSFVSGHASAGYFLVSVGFLGGLAARRRWTVIGLVVGALFGLGRITQGGHFLSDVIFSFYATWLGAWVAWLLFVRLGWLPDTGITGQNSADKA